MKIVIKRNGFKVKIKINSYELYKLKVTHEQLKDMIDSALKPYEFCKNDK